MKVQVNAQKTVGIYQDPTCWQNSTLRYVPPVDFPAFLAGRVGKAKIMRTWITLDEYWDYRTGTTYPDYEIGKLRYPVEQLHYVYDLAQIVPAPSGTRFVDYLTTHSQNAQELMLNVRRYEREVSDGVITYDQYEAVFEQAVEYCKELAPNIRYVECCNEVDIKTFGLLSPQEYVNIYLRAHKAIQRLNKKHNYPIALELGGFAQAHTLQTRQMMIDVMKLLKASPIGDDPMAFYSYHLYNAPENRSLTAAGMLELTQLTGVEKLKLMVANHEEMIRQLDLPQRPVFLDELGRARATGLDGDSLHNAAGLITYLLAFAVGDLGQSYPFPWCTFHNPQLQMSYTQYLLREDGSYAATPNGIAIEMLHGMRGQILEQSVSQSRAADPQYSAIALRDGEEIAVLMVNTYCDSVPAVMELEGMEDGRYTVDVYRCDLIANNIVYKRGKGDGTLQKTDSHDLAACNGTLRHVQTLDRDGFVLLRINRA